MVRVKDGVGVRVAVRLRVGGSVGLRVAGWIPKAFGAGVLLPALEVTMYVSLSESLFPLGSSSKVLSLLGVVIRASGSDLDPSDPVLLGGAWWHSSDVCSLARPQASPP